MGVVSLSTNADNQKIAVVTDVKGKKFEFEVRVMERILVNEHKFSLQDAQKMCWGFGMDPRAGPARRMTSCTCGQPLKAASHQFPAGFTYAVRRLYKKTLQSFQ